MKMKINLKGEEMKSVALDSKDKSLFLLILNQGCLVITQISLPVFWARLFQVPSRFVQNWLKYQSTVPCPA